MIAGWGSAAGGVAIVIFFVAMFALWVGLLVLWILAIVDIARRPDWQFKVAGQEKLLWLLLTIFISFVAVIYWFAIRKKLIAVEQAAATGALGPGYVTWAGWQPGVEAPWSAPGWYADPSGQGQFRYWDGSRWTEHVSPPAGTGNEPS